MARYGSEKIRGHGIPEAMEAILIGRSRIQPKVAVLKPLSSAISIGTGGPFGAEGPIIMTGGAFGSLFAQLFHLSRRRTQDPAGRRRGGRHERHLRHPGRGHAVGGRVVAVRMEAPQLRARGVRLCVAAAWRARLMGAGVAVSDGGERVAAADRLLFAGLGVLAGLASGLLTQMVYGGEDLFQRLPSIGCGGPCSVALRSASADSSSRMHSASVRQHCRAPPWRNVGAGVTAPGVGEGGDLGGRSGVGTSGGVLAPLAHHGRRARRAVRHVSVGDPGLWALIGMAAMMGGTMRSPLTSIVFAIELTHDLGALLPLAAACTMAHATTVLLLRRSILTEKVARRGHHVTREYIVDPFESVRVKEIMARSVDSFAADVPISDVVAFFAEPDAPPRHKSYPVVEADGQVLRMIARTDVFRWSVDGWPDGEILRDLSLDRDLFTAYEDELVGHLADRMAAADVSRVPILRRSDGALVGLVARRDLLRVRARAVKHEAEREILIRLRP